jgi:SpoVK/Ycf46/Vps4 family AAA+-type ATPase
MEEFIKTHVQKLITHVRGLKQNSTGGVRALFMGSREQTTEAAQTVARGLALPLYRIDVAAVVSQYIGETEKNLDRVFGEAEPGSVLLLDEADGLFGKRSEVKDSHDRYASMDALQTRLERYTGVAIVATRCDVEEGERKRFPFHVKFPG